MGLCLVKLNYDINQGPEDKIGSLLIFHSLLWLPGHYSTYPWGDTNGGVERQAGTLPTFPRMWWMGDGVLLWAPGRTQGEGKKVSPCSSFPNHVGSAYGGKEVGL